MNAWKTWICRLLTVNIFILFGFFLVSTLILYEFRELYNDDEILLEYDNVLLGSAITDSSLMKFKVVAQKKPRVVAIGSSRVMQFRSNYFVNKDFYTMGGNVWFYYRCSSNFQENQ